MRDIKTCVIGLGSMGRNHARVLGDLQTAAFVGVADPAANVRAAYRPLQGVKVYAEYREMLERERPEAAIVAVPSELHCEIVADLAAAGVHVLVEKPMSKRLDEADRMIEVTRAAGVKFMVGHIERFNPAVQEIKQRVASKEIGEVFQLHARRLSPFPPRVTDVGVILDLATHDIDVMHFITGSTVVRTYAETARRAHATCEDTLNGLLRFSNGVVGVLDISWLSPQKLRQLSVLGPGGMYVCDYLTQDVHFYKNGRINDSWEPATHFSGAIEGDVLKTYIPKREPLRVELEAFLACILDDTPPPVSGEEGRTALRVALELGRSGVEHSVLEPPQAR